MSASVFDSLRDLYDPDPRAMVVVFLGSLFCSYVLLTTPFESQSPYYRFALAANLFAFLVSSSSLAFDWLR
ncbi:hypothetical protein ACFQJC_04095 [Haloferax namakaokahaiae]|uniref:Uncharacterized protein n=1 Tax=Haloferax namakaokahaiae TaxID=1748331 RepID=A0ABD5ZBU2_9EURY